LNNRLYRLYREGHGKGIKHRLGFLLGGEVRAIAIGLGTGRQVSLGLLWGFSFIYSCLTACGQQDDEDERKKSSSHGMSEGLAKILPVGGGGLLSEYISSGLNITANIVQTRTEVLY
jgi:hypothetical protein